MNLSKGKTNNRIPKNRFLFDMPEIESIYIRYKIAKSTLGISDSEEYKELEIFEVVFKDKVVLKYFAKIQVPIKYQILFCFKEKGIEKYALVFDDYIITTDKKLLFGDDLQVSAIDIKGLIEKLAEQMVSFKRKDGESLKEMIDRQKKIDELENEIEKLQKLVDNEKQPNIRFDLNRELKKVKKILMLLKE